MTERNVERKYVQKIKDQGGRAYKFVSPGHAKVPDRLILKPIPIFLQDMIAQYIHFAELKDTDKKPDAGQKREIERIRKLGFKVEVVDR